MNPSEAAIVRRNSARPGRRSLSRWVTIVLVVALAAAIGLDTEYRPASTAGIGAAVFDPAAFGAEVYESKVVPAIRAGATDLPVLLGALATDSDAAGARYGHRQGTGPYSFAVRGTGVAGKVNGSMLEVAVPGVPPGTRVLIQVGPAIAGTALRDACGCVTFGQFRNQVEYADAATALNNEMRTRLLDGLRPSSLDGRKISFTGAFTFLTLATVTITPIAVEETP